MLQDRAEGLIEAQLFTRQARPEAFRKYTIVAENNVAIATRDVELQQSNYITCLFHVFGVFFCGRFLLGAATPCISFLQGSQHDISFIFGSDAIITILVNNLQSSFAYLFIRRFPSDSVPL
jgi:hypothetical protein